MTALHTTYILVFTFALIYVAFRFRRWGKGPAPTDGTQGFRPEVGFTRLDGMESLSLLLDNESKTHVWAEEIEISLSDLVANDQTGDPSCRETLKIRQMVQSKDLLPMSLAGVIYKAAGEPQREYSCVLSSVLRFRMGETWFEKNLEDYRIHMIGLTASGVRRQRKRAPTVRSHEHPREVAVAAAKSK
jgi:hypothetical protein